MAIDASSVPEQASIEGRGTFGRIKLAFVRAHFGIATVAIAYAIGLFAGGVLVHTNSGFALRFRDHLIGDAQQTSPILGQLQKKHRLTAASLDAGGNAAAGLLDMLAGYFPPTGYWIAGYRGWIGGVVSVDGAHHSRLTTRHEAFYFLTILLLQLIPFTFTGGAGVNLGIAAFAKPAWTGYEGRRVKWLLIPFDAISDAGWIYLVALPMFAVASLFEFLM